MQRGEGYRDGEMFGQSLLRAKSTWYWRLDSRKMKPCQEASPRSIEASWRVGNRHRGGESVRTWVDLEMKQVRESCAAK